MLNKNDPLIGAVQEVMKRNQAEREAAKLVNEKFGVTDRKAMPHERLGEWDAAYKTVLTEGVEALDEKSFAALAPPYDKATQKDRLVGAGVLKKHPTQPGKHVLAKEENLDERVKENKIKKNEVIAKIGAKARKAGDPRHLNNLNGIPGGTGILQDVGDKIRGRELTSGRERRPLEEDDVTSPSSMGIKGPDYATGTPDYAKSKEQTVNRAAKTSLPAGTVAKSIKEAKVNPYAVGMAAVKKSTGDEPPMEKKNIMKAHKIAKKIIAKKKMNEGFNNRHDSSVTASVEEQVVAELYAVPGTPAGNAYANALRRNQGTGKALPFQAGQKSMSPVGDASRGTVRKTTNRFVSKPGLRSASVSQKSGINAATGGLTATDTQRRASYSVTDVRDAAYGKNPTAKKLGPASSTGASGPSPVPTSSAVVPKLAGGARPSFVAKNKSNVPVGGARPSFVAKNTPTVSRPAAGIGPSNKPMPAAPTVSRPAAGIGPGNKPMPAAATPAKAAPAVSRPAAGIGPGNKPMPAAATPAKAAPAQSISNTTTASAPAKAAPAAPAKAAPAAPAKPKMSALQRQIRNSRNYRDSAVTGPGGRRG